MAADGTPSLPPSLCSVRPRGESHKKASGGERETEKFDDKGNELHCTELHRKNSVHAKSSPVLYVPLCLSCVRQDYKDSASGGRQMMSTFYEAAKKRLDKNIVLI